MTRKMHDLAVADRIKPVKRLGGIPSWPFLLFLCFCLRVVAMDSPQNQHVKVVLKAKEIAQLSSEVNGRIVKITRHFGQGFKKGDLLIELDDARYRGELAKVNSRLARAEAYYNKILKMVKSRVRIDAAQAKVNSAEGELRRIKELIKSGVKLKKADAALSAAKVDYDATRSLMGDGDATKVELEQTRSIYASALAEKEEIRLKQIGDLQTAQNMLEEEKARKREIEMGEEPEVEVAKADVEVVQSELVLVEQDIKACKIFAPYDGKVFMKLDVHEHEMVNAGKPLMVIAEDNVLLARFLLPEKVYRKIHKDMVVKIHIASTNENVEGRISRISASIDPASRAFEVFADIDNSSGRFSDGMHGYLDINDLLGK